ncbi:hypothetical protein ACWC09_25015 [Streptomyces sp. NPDC001617]
MTWHPAPGRIALPIGATSGEPTPIQPIGGQVGLAGFQRAHGLAGQPREGR